MAGLEAAILAGDSCAASSMSATLFARHGPFAAWSTLWWSTVVRSTQSPDPTSAAQPRIISATIAHVSGIADLAPNDLQTVVSSWLDGLTPSDLQDFLAYPGSANVCTLLLNLVARRQLQTAPLLAKLVYPCWQYTAMRAVMLNDEPLGKQCQAVETTIVFSRQLLLASPRSKHLPPTDLHEALIMQTARVEVFDRKNVQVLIRHLPFLVVLETVKGMSDKVRSHISTLFQSLASAPDFKGAVIRHLELVKAVFLSGDWSKPSVDPRVEAGMVDALKLIMSDGSSSKCFLSFPMPAFMV